MAEIPTIVIQQLRLSNYMFIVICPSLSTRFLRGILLQNALKLHRAKKFYYLAVITSVLQELLHL